MKSEYTENAAEIYLEIERQSSFLACYCQTLTVEAKGDAVQNP